MKKDFKFNELIHYRGKPCGNGHSGTRYISNDVCVDCLRMYDRKDYYKRYNREERRIPRLYATKLLHSCKTRSVIKKWEFNLTHEWICKKLEAGVCEVTGLNFDFKKPTNGNHLSPFAPSIDRIDSFKPYTMENCRVVCVIYNVCKGQWTDKDVLEFAKAVTNALDKAQS